MLKGYDIVNRSVRILLLSIAVLALFCASAFATETRESLLVTPEWLKENLNKVVLIDARPKSLYTGQQGHLPGAVNAEWTYFANMAGTAGKPGWGAVVGPETMAKRLSLLGIDGKKPVVVYGDAGDWGQSGWVVWILRMSGIKNARMLDGGFMGWRAIKGKTDNVVYKAKPASIKIPQYAPGYSVNTKWVVDNMGRPDIAIVDVRTPLEYAGTIRPFQEKRGGHIPGATSLPMDVVFSADYTILPVEDLKGIIEKHGLTSTDQDIVLYDTAGVRSSFMTMVFRLAGYKNARSYDPAFHEWAGNMSLDIVQGN